MACAIKKRLTPSRDNPAIRIQYRVVNTRGDFTFVVMETVKFHMYTPRPILEYTPMLTHGKLHYTTVHTEQETQLVFSFVRCDRNHRKLATFLTQ